MDVQNKIAAVPDDIIRRDIDSTSVLLNLENGRYYSLNSTGAFAFSLFDGKTSISQVASRIADAFCVEQAEALKDLEDLVVELHKEGLVELHD